MYCGDPKVYCGGPEGIARHEKYTAETQKCTAVARSKGQYSVLLYSHKLILKKVYKFWVLILGLRLYYLLTGFVLIILT